MTEPVPLHAHHDDCFGCGPTNPASIGLRFVRAGDRVRATMRLGTQHQGAPGFAHGGVLAAALDDTLGTLLLILRRPAVTAKLEIDYRRPAFIERDYELEAWTHEVDGRKLHLHGHICEPGGEVVAEARALFLVVELEHFSQGGADWPDAIKDRWRDQSRDLPY